MDEVTRDAATADDVVWVEQLSRHREVVLRHRLSGPEIRIGRGYANDVIVDDPHVAAAHLVIRRDDDGTLVAVTLAGSDGLYDERTKRSGDRFALDGDRVLRIGHTLLRVREASHSVPRERPYRPRWRSWPAVAILAAAILGLTALSTWLESVGEPKLTTYLTPLLTLSVLVLAWAALWSVLARIFAGQAKFERNVIIALASLLAYSLVAMIAAGLSYAVSWDALSRYDYVGYWSALAIVCFLHLRAIRPTRLWLKGGVVVAFLAVAVGMQTLARSELHGAIALQTYTHRLLPPAFRLAPPQTEAAFVAEIEALKSELDGDRTKEAPHADPDGGDD